MTKVSVVIPCYNEEKNIVYLLGGILAQTYPVKDLEVIIADGMSTDNTRGKINAFQKKTPEMAITIVENPEKTIPSALNKAICAASGEIIVRLDAHSIPNSDYIARCVEVLASGKAESVGGIWLVQPGDESWVARSIAQAGSHRLGVGDARYRYTNSAGFVETVPFGAFKKDLFLRIGPYDETLHSNEDYEFNTRIIQAGGKIWLDPAIQSRYYARPTFTKLAHQYWRYGYWKAQMLKRYPKTIRLRQALPPIFVLGLASLLLLSVFFPIFFFSLIGVICLYFLILMLASLKIALQKRYLPFIIGIPIAICIMHICWGSGFIWRFISGLGAK